MGNMEKVLFLLEGRYGIGEGSSRTCTEMAGEEKNRRRERKTIVKG